MTKNNRVSKLVGLIAMETFLGDSKRLEELKEIQAEEKRAKAKAFVNGILLSGAFTVTLLVGLKAFGLL